MNLENNIFAYNKFFRIFLNEQGRCGENKSKFRQLKMPIFLDSTKLIATVRLMELDLTDRKPLPKELDIKKTYQINSNKNLN